jgi:DNA-binding response OmpR family regulator
MKVLVVEDDDDKRGALAAFLRQTYEIDEVLLARSFHGGLRRIIDDKPAIVFLDMTMPNFDRTVADDGGRPHAFAGREILRQMQRLGDVTPVLIVTQFNRFGDESNYVSLDTLEAELRRRFPNYVDTIQYRSNVDDWKPAILDAVGELIKRRGSM